MICYQKSYFAEDAESVLPQPGKPATWAKLVRAGQTTAG
jgi:hypothetical protein